MSEVSGRLITLHFGKRVVWSYPAELSSLFGGFISRFRTSGPPDIALTVGIREQADPFEIEGFACFFREPPSELDFINVLSYWTRRLLAPQLASALVLHASAVEARRGALLLMGPRGSGKTTLAKALCEEGYPFIAEDGAPVGVDDILVHPSLPMSFLPDSIAGPTKLFRIIAISYAPGSRTALSELRGREASLEILRENFNLKATGSRGLALVARLSERGIISLSFPERDEGLRVIREIAEREPAPR
jgi:hypothetical protein